MSSQRNEPNSPPQETHRVTPEQREPQQGKSRRWRRFPWLLGAGLALAGIAALAYYFLYGQYHVKTTDAYVQGDLTRIAPQVPGTVTGIAADETQYVRQGGLLVRLDPTDNDVALARAEAGLAQTPRPLVRTVSSRRCISAPPASV